MRICKNLGVFLLLGPFFLTVFGQNQPYTAQDLEVIHSVLPQDQPYMLFSKGFIGEKWNTGEYRVEGYTQSSFYADSTEAIFPQKIWVVDRIDKQKPQDTKAIQQRDNIRLGLYPEGGYLVQGIKNYVAFKTTDNQGMPAPLNGWLCENGARILDIESYHDGMGLFSFVPQEGIRYTVQLTNGQEFPLPTSLRSGMVMHLEHTDRKMPRQPFTMSSSVR